MKDALIILPAPQGRARPATTLTLRKLRWEALIPYVSVYALCLGAFFTRFDQAILSLFAVSYLVRMFGLTICYHRYFAHRSFKTSRPLQFILAVIGSGGPKRTATITGAPTRQTTSTPPASRAFSIHTMAGISIRTTRPRTSIG